MVEEDQLLSRHIGRLILMAARHAIKERGASTAFAFQQTVEAIGHLASPVDLESAGQEIATQLLFLQSPFHSMSWGAEMKAAVRVMLPLMRPQRRAMVAEQLRRSYEWSKERT